jgi:muramoyltetrapeptide carboxypeptidase
MDIPNTHPAALRPGSTICVVAPAGPVEDAEALNRGIATLERLGFQVRYDRRIFESTRYLAGDDRGRAEELMHAFEDPEVDGVVSLRGGYGCARLIPLLDERRLRPHCKLFMGFSDLTTLHLYFRRRFGWVTVHGPMMTSVPLGSISPGQERHLISLLTDDTYLPRLSIPGLQAWKPGVAEGRLVGGCLSLVVASLGTSYEVRTEGKILFFEDLGEEPYRLDRMITQLRLAGKFDEVAGILLGSFKDCETAGAPYQAVEVLADLLADLDIPVLANFPAGHGDENWALPVGVRVRLDADSRSLEFLEPAVA